MFFKSCPAPGPAATADAMDARPNSITTLRADTPASDPQPQDKGTPDHSPMLLSSRLNGDEVLITLDGVTHTYLLHSHGGRASRLAPGALVYVRVSRANTRHAEIYEPSTVHHRFLGHAIDSRTRP
ncbi:MAG: hypothetical protein V4726_11140 [Verrucomicrobiota bacterium]